MGYRALLVTERNVEVFNLYQTVTQKSDVEKGNLMLTILTQ